MRRVAWLLLGLVASSVIGLWCSAECGLVGLAGAQGDEWAYDGNWHVKGYGGWVAPTVADGVIEWETEQEVTWPTINNCYGTTGGPAHILTGPTGDQPWRVWFLETGTEEPVLLAIVPSYNAAWTATTYVGAGLQGNFCSLMGKTGILQVRLPGVGVFDGAKTEQVKSTEFWGMRFLSNSSPYQTSLSFSVAGMQKKGQGCSGGVCHLTEAQGADFVHGLQALVILVAIGVPCLVALVTAAAFAFFRRG